MEGNPLWWNFSSDEMELADTMMIFEKSKNLTILPQEVSFPSIEG
jgi:hypothetical protein